MRVLVDTGVFINILNKEPNYENSVKLLEKIQRKEIEGFISVITIAEIFSIFYRISEEETLIAKTCIETFITEDRIVPIIKRIAEFAGRIKASYNISLGDAFIVATAILAGCECLVSLDPEIKKVDLIDVKEPKEFL
jgi:predicted nucleic acid-binding protein